MQNRHTDRRSYFDESAATSRKHYVPYIETAARVGPSARVIEIGCGEGGNLKPFAERGCEVTGVDITAGRIEQAREYFAQDGAAGRFVCGDAAALGAEFEGRFDILLAHDVIEHVSGKQAFMDAAWRLLRPGGTAFFGFPAWQMPFGGHQQICSGRFCSHAPFLHLLPRALYRRALEAGGESGKCVSELMCIRDTRVTVEMFERLARRAGFAVAGRRFWLVNPHYETKFGMRPRELWGWLGRIPCLRDFFITSAFYLLRRPG